MEPVVGEEGAQGCGKIFGVVVAKFCHREETGLVGLLVVAVHTKVLLQHRIQPLCLAIRQGAKSGRAVGADSQEKLREIGCEDGITIAD